jgi:peptidoglycan/LPS O-acetylase OafA/YrhL
LRLHVARDREGRRVLTLARPHAEVAADDAPAPSAVSDSQGDVALPGAGPREATSSEAPPDEADTVTRGEADPPAGTPGGVDLEFRPDVEGLRAVAILLVVLFHCGVSTGGFVGVDVFFVISGFLITGLLLREHDLRRRVSLPGFYARRARRILPAGMVVIMATILIAHAKQNFLAYAQTADDGKWAAWFLANIHFATTHQDYFNQGAPPSPLLHYWSLAVEEQFYFVWPAIVLLVGLATPRRWPVRRPVLVVATVAVVASFLWARHVGPTNSIWAFYSPLTRAWELGIGALAATLVGVCGRLHRWAGCALAFGGLAAICVAAATYSSQYASATQLLVPVLGSVAVVVGGASGIGAGWVLGCTPPRGTGAAAGTWWWVQRCNPMRAIGRVSYGWYLLHYPPMVLWAGVLYLGPLPVHERLLIAAITLAIAFAMYYAFERPIRRSRWLAKLPWVSILMGLAFVIGAWLLCANYTKSLY